MRLVQERRFSEISFLVFASALILIAFSLVCVLKGVGRFPDGPVSVVADVTRSLAHGGSLLPMSLVEEVHEAYNLSKQTHSYVWQDIVSLNSAGQYIPKHSVLSSILAVPFYIAFGDVGFWILQQLFAIVLVYSVFSLSKHIFDKANVCTALVVCFLFSQTVFYIYSYAHDLHGCALLIFGLAIMQRGNRIAPVAGVVLMCLSVIIRPSYLLLVFLLAFGGRVNDSTERRLLSLMGLGIGGAIIAVYNQIIWGNPIATPYTFVPVFYDGQQMLSEHPVGFSWEVLGRDWFRKLFGLTGLMPANIGFIFAPFVAIFCWTHRHRRFLLKVYGSALFYMMYVFSYEMWSVSALGNRFLFPAIYLYLVLLVGFIDHLVNRAISLSNRVEAVNVNP